ncbi:hypothetical protein BC832DRAFT_560193 [Gaertneriomyces semiglobifer]|nr:hypothetical protein BC832DRAFT_560193 [Gaertneriomyces semiglobifer]
MPGLEDFEGMNRRVIISHMKGSATTEQQTSEGGAEGAEGGQSKPVEAGSQTAESAETVVNHPSCWMT